MALSSLMSSLQISWRVQYLVISLKCVWALSHIHYFFSLHSPVKTRTTLPLIGQVRNTTSGWLTWGKITRVSGCNNNQPKLTLFNTDNSRNYQRRHSAPDLLKKGKKQTETKSKKDTTIQGSITKLWKRVQSHQSKRWTVVTLTFSHSGSRPLLHG